MTLAVAPASPVTHKQEVLARSIFLLSLKEKRNGAEKKKVAKKGVWIACG